MTPQFSVRTTGQVELSLTEMGRKCRCRGNRKWFGQESLSCLLVMQEEMSTDWVSLSTPASDSI